MLRDLGVCMCLNIPVYTWVVDIYIVAASFLWNVTQFAVCYCDIFNPLQTWWAQTNFKTLNWFKMFVITLSFALQGLIISLLWSVAPCMECDRSGTAVCMHKDKFLCNPPKSSAVTFWHNRRITRVLPSNREITWCMPKNCLRMSYS